MTPKRFRVLVVDDEINIRLGAERILSKEGFDVLTAESGEEGLELLEGNEVHILLLDLMMPGIGGMEVLKKVSVSQPGLLVIVITGHATLETAIDSMKFGAYDFIPKPFKPDQLRIVVFRATETLRLREEHRRLEEERQRNLRAIEREKTRTRIIVRCMSEGVLLTDQGNVVLYNPAARDMFGLEQDLGACASVAECIPDEELREQILDMGSGVQDGEPTVRTHEFQAKNGRWILSKVSPIATEESEEGSVLTVLSDVTTQKNLAQLKSEFVAKVSHDLRSPLAAINQQLALLGYELEGNEHEEHRQRLVRLRARVKGLLSLIADLLDLSRIELGMETGGAEAVDPVAVLQRALEVVTPRMKKKGLNLDIDISTTPAVIECDPRDLESVFVNLLTNAMKYTSPPGSVAVRTTVGDRAFRASIQDTGIGISKDDLPHIFDKFYRVKSEATRQVVQGIIQWLGGRIDVESELGAGSTFTVELPLRATSPEG